MTSALSMLLLWLMSPFSEPLCPPDATRLHEWAVCLDVARAAREEGISPRLAVTLAWSESRLRADRVSPVGAVGPLQVVPRYWCPGRKRHGCDVTRAGTRALRVLIDRHGTERGLCHYAAGNVCTPRALRYARYILMAKRCHMANDFSATFAAPDVSALLASRRLTGDAVAPLGVASNWCAAHVGSGTPRIWQTWPARGTGATPLWTVDDASPVAVTSWAIPGTRGASSIVAWVWGASVAGAGEVYLTSETAAGTSAVKTLPPTSWLVGPLTLAVDPDGDVVTMWVDGHSAVAWVSAIHARTPAETSPLGTGLLASGCVGIDANELATAQTLAEDQGRQIRTNASTLRAVPHVYGTWSGLGGTSLGGEPAWMRAVAHVWPCPMWPDSIQHGWTVTVKVLVKGIASVASQVVVCVYGLGSRRVRGYLRLEVEAGAAIAWREGTISLRGGGALAHLPIGITSCVLLVIPAPTETAAADWSRVTGIDADYQTTATVLSISTWGR